MLLENKKVAIIGGGPGGLTLARLLQLEGVDVKVYERDVDAAARLQGATLDLHYESGLKAIEKAGLMNAFKSSYRPGAEKGRVMDKMGNIIYDEHNNETVEDFGNEHFRPEIDRSDLRAILLNALKPNTVVWDSQFKSMSKVGESWQLEFKNGTIVTADIIVGADGANSKIRPFLTPIQSSYAGVTIIQGNIENSEINTPKIHQILKGGKIYIYANEKYLHISSKGDGSLDFYISCKKDKNWVKNSGIDFSDKEQITAWARTEFNGWDAIWFELFENLSSPLFLRPQYCIPFDQTWETQSNLTILGDAAHIMPPSGEGVNLAMLDALELSQSLTQFNAKDIKTAIAAYEEPMRLRGAKEAKVAIDMAEWMHSDEALTKMVEMIHQD